MLLSLLATVGTVGALFLVHRDDPIARGDRRRFAAAYFRLSTPKSKEK